MKTIAFYGGSSISELGPAADVELFFDCIKEFVVLKFPEQDWDIITDRLYRRYLRKDELDPAATMMKQVKQTFKSISNTAVDMDGMKSPTAKTRLDLTRQNLAEIFVEYFEHFTFSKESAEIFFKTWKIYKPVMIIVSDLPQFINEGKRNLEDYDALEGKPFWLR